MGHLFSVCYGTSNSVPLLSSRLSKLSNLKILWSSEGSIQDFVLDIVIESLKFCYESVDLFFVCLGLGCCHFYVRGGGGWLDCRHLRFGIGGGAVGLFWAFFRHVPLGFTVEASSFLL